MDLYEYRQLSTDERANLLWQEGLFIDGYNGRRKSYMLYFIHSFYVEVELDGQKIDQVVPFRKGHRLDKYLDKLPLQWLM